MLNKKGVIGGSIPLILGMFGGHVLGSERADSATREAIGRIRAAGERDLVAGTVAEEDPALEALRAKVNVLREAARKVEPTGELAAIASTGIPEDPALEALRAKVNVLREAAGKVEPTGEKTASSEVSGEEFVFESDGEEFDEATQDLWNSMETGCRTSEALLHALKRGADLTSKDGYGGTLLHRMCGDPLTTLLNLKAINVNEPDSEGNTPLHYALDSDEVQWFLVAGANTSAKNDDE
jgi:hypothetical protein